VKLARSLGICGVLVLAGTLYFLVPVDRNPVGGVVLRTSVSCLLLLALAAAVVAQARLAAADGNHRIDGLIIALVVVWFVFALGFYSLDLRRPDEVAGLKTRLDALYFVISTMLTVGYGDIHAAGQLARGLVVVELVFDVAFVATSGALVRAHMRDKAAQRASDQSFAAARRRAGIRARTTRRRPPRTPADSRGDEKTSDPPAPG
jgi:voltage-gated potassium channel